MNVILRNLARALTLPALAGTSLLLVAHGGGSDDEAINGDCADFGSSYVEFDGNGACGLDGRIQVGAAEGKCELDVTGLSNDEGVSGGRDSELLEDGRWQFTWEPTPGTLWICDVGDARVGGVLPVECKHFGETCEATLTVVPE